MACPPSPGVPSRFWRETAAIAFAEDELRYIYYLSELPEDQQEAASHIYSLLREAAHLVRNFREALDLFDHALKRRDVASRAAVPAENQGGAAPRMSRIVRMQRWQTIAARDGAMTIYQPVEETAVQPK